MATADLWSRLRWWMSGALSTPWEGVSSPESGGCSRHLHTTLQFSLVLTGGAHALSVSPGRGSSPGPHHTSCFPLALWLGHVCERMG